MIREQAIHKDVIASFLEGKDVQFFSRKNWEWEDTDEPLFSVGTEYRVKPEKVYTTMYVVYNTETGEVFEVFKRKDIAENFSGFIKTNHTVKEVIIETECE